MKFSFNNVTHIFNKKSYENDYLNYSSLKYLVDYDEQTGIYNRNKLLNETKKLLSKNKNETFAFISIEINQIKIIKNLLGKNITNHILKNMSSKIKNVRNIHGVGTYGRISQEVFSMCLPYNKDNMIAMLEYLKKDLSEINMDFQIEPHFGIYIIDDITLPIETICDNANAALNTISENYIDSYAFYDENLHKKLTNEQEIIGEMFKALRNEEFDIYLQPKYSFSSNTVIGAEALVRWIHPIKGILSPTEFIPIFEKNGFIMHLDIYVWNRVCILIKKWLLEGKTPYPISVNVSKVDFLNPNLYNIITKMIEKYEIPPNLIEFEITESAYAENMENINSTMKKLQKYGITILMDDFGSGYSCLNMLKDFHVNILKLDLKFLSKSESEGRGGNIIACVIRMAKYLKIPVIAEGIETREQFEFLKTIGCMYGQGYFFSKPIPFHCFEDKYSTKNKIDLVNNSSIFHSNFNIDELYNSNSFINILFNGIATPCGICEIKGTEFESIRLNDSCFDMLETTREEFYFDHTRLIDRVPDSDKPIIEEILKEALNSKKSSEGIHRIICPNDKILYLHTKITYLAFNGDTYLFLVNSNDITNSK
ncbi:MAG: EAL domain-containing protein [Clostridium sp.]|nr:EAL domain-containing protein [Clostridium sp.]